MSIITAPLVQIARPLENSPLEVGFGSGPFQLGGNLYLVCTNPVQGTGYVSWPDATPPPVAAKLHCYMSTDNGANWNELDAAHAVAVTQPNGGGLGTAYASPTAACQLDANNFIAAFTQWDYVAANSPTLRYITFNMATGLWGAISTAGPNVATLPSSGIGNSPPMSVQYRASDGSVIIEWNGQETVGMSQFSRVFYAIYNAGWTGAIAMDATQTGSTLHYSLSGGVSGSGNRTHFFYAIEDPAVNTLLDQVTLNAANVLQAVVTITTQPTPELVDISQPFAQTIAGVTTIGVSYNIAPVFPGNQEMSIATSADAPAFAQTLVATATAYTAMQSAGTNGAAGLTAANDNINASGFNGAWSLPMFVGTEVGSQGGGSGGIVGQPIAFKSSTGFVVNSLTAGENNGDTFVQFFAFAPGGCPTNSQGV